MLQVHIKLHHILNWCQSCEWVLNDYYYLFGLMFNYNHFEKMRLSANSDEIAECAEKSRDETLNEILNFMDAHCIPANIRRDIWYVCKCLNC